MELSRALVTTTEANGSASPELASNTVPVTAAILGLGRPSPGFWPHATGVANDKSSPHVNARRGK